MCFLDVEFVFADVDVLLRWFGVRHRSLVSQMKSIRAIVSHATVADLEMDQIDIDAAFLTSKIDKRIFVKQPEGFEVKGHETEAAELLASIYGTKQAARCHSHRDSQKSW